MTKMITRRLLIAITAVFIAGCASESEVAAPDTGILDTPLFRGGPNARPAAWADGELFDVIVPPAVFEAGRGKFDELYAGTAFKDGVPLISDSKPGDQDYNGGRWHLNVLRAGVDPGKYADADSDEDLDLADFESTDTYFECPLLPRRGKN